MSPSTSPPGSSGFHTTHWSVLLNAGDTQEDTDQVLEELCTTYWRPIHGFIRRRGHSAEEARDLTQGFFARFLEHPDLEALDPDQGRFRAYLLACVKHFLSNERDRERALKRGGGVRPLALDFDQAESSLRLEPEDARTPETEFEREWALSVLRRGLERLRVEQAGKDRAELFERLKPTLAGEAVEGGYAAIADDLGLTTVAIKVAAHRLRKRYGELLLDEIARTVEVPQQIEDELATLFRALG